MDENFYSQRVDNVGNRLPSGGSRVGVVGLQSPLLLASEIKHKVLKPHCAHYQYLIKNN